MCSSIIFWDIILCYSKESEELVSWEVTLIPRFSLILNKMSLVNTINFLYLGGCIYYQATCFIINWFSHSLQVLYSIKSLIYFWAYHNIYNGMVWFQHAPLCGLSMSVAEWRSYHRHHIQKPARHCVSAYGASCWLSGWKTDHSIRKRMASGQCV